MWDFLAKFGLAFLPIFVAVDAIGVLPIYMGLTDGVQEAARRRIVRQAMITALIVAVGFTIAGRELLRLIGVTVADFQVAGGSVLFILATIDIVSARKFARESTTLGAVPLGVPLIVGPAVLTTAIIMVGEHDYLPTILALVLNILLAGAVMLAGGPISRALGLPASRALMKVFNLVLAAFGVMMIRNGVLRIVEESARRAP